MSRRLKLETDDEQQQHDAEFGEMGDGLDIADQPECVRTDQDACGEIGEYGTQPQQPEQRHRDDGGRQQDGDLPEQFHDVSL